MSDHYSTHTTVGSLTKALNEYHASNPGGYKSKFTDREGEEKTVVLSIFSTGSPPTMRVRISKL